MQISELTLNQGNVEVEGVVKEIGEIRAFNKFGRDLRVADAVLEDDSGSVKLTLWNDDVDRIKKGDKVKIVNGYVREFQGEKQLTSGKFGKIEKVGEGEASDSGQEELSEESPAEPAAEESESSEPAEESEEIKEEEI